MSSIFSRLLIEAKLAGRVSCAWRCRAGAGYCGAGGGGAWCGASHNSQVRGGAARGSAWRLIQCCVIVVMRVRLMQAVNFDDPLSPLRITNLSEACRPPTPIPSPTFPSTPRVCACVHVSAFHPRELGRPEHAHAPHPDHARSVSAVRGWRQRNRASRASRHPSGPDPPHRIAVASGISMTLSRSCSGWPPTHYILHHIN